MQKLKTHILYMFMTLFAIMVLTSCSHDEASYDVPQEELLINIGFRLPMESVSRAGYEEGVLYEDYIDDYRIYFFDTYNTLIARFVPETVVEHEKNGFKSFEVKGKAPSALIKKKSFKVVVLANWETQNNVYGDATLVPGVTTIRDICNAEWAQFECLKGAALSVENDRLIPFYGVHQYDNVTFKPDEITLLNEPVTLLRAMAKVEIILDMNEKVSLTSAEICGYNDKGYCAPDGVYSQDDYGQGNNWDTDYLRQLHLVNDKNDDNATLKTFPLLCESKRVDATKKEKWTAYVPEFKNIDAGENYSHIQLKFNFQGAEEKKHNIYFTKYDTEGKNNVNKNRLNIERNNIYRFNVKVSPIIFRVSVEQWKFGGKVHIDM